MQSNRTANIDNQKTNWIGLCQKICAVVAVFGLFYMASALFRQHVDLQSFLDFVKSSGPLAPLIYCGIYLIGPTIFLPASLLTMAGGAIFGPVMGTIYTIFSATLGATIPFLITRKFGRKPMEKLLSRHVGFEEKFEKFKHNVEKQGWKYVAFTRLVTLFPFLVLNYAFGLTRVKLWTYIWASFVFMLPGSFMFNYMGYAGREALTGSEDIVLKVAMAVGCLLLLSTLPSLAKNFESNKEKSD